MLKRIALTTAIPVTAMGVLETGASLVATGRPGIGLPAEAIVSRLLAPVRVAGVAGRSVARCAATAVIC
jgi:hypothetical protein